MMLTTHYLFGLILFILTFILGNLILIKIKSSFIKNIIFFPIVSISSSLLILSIYLYNIFSIPILFILFGLCIKNKREIYLIIKDFFFNFKFLIINIILLIFCINNSQ